MNRTPQAVKDVGVSSAGSPAASIDSQKVSQSRRKFLGKVGIATAAAGVLGSVPKALAQPVKVATILSYQSRRTPPMATNTVTPTSQPATVRVCCRTTSAWLITPHGNRSRRR